MKRKNIKTIAIFFNDTDFVRMWDWIGETLLNTINKDTNICSEFILEDSKDIEDFVKSLIVPAFEFIQQKNNKYTEVVKYRRVSKVDRILYKQYFKKTKFKYNKKINYTGNEVLIVDIENNKSYII